MSKKRLVLLLCSLLLLSWLVPAQKVEAIVGGNTVQSSSTYSWIGSISEEGAPGYCGGTLISDQWVLTAKHCITDSISYDSSSGGSIENFKAYASIRFGSLDPMQGGTTRTFVDYTPHNSADLALLKLSSPVSYSPITLTDSNSLNYVGNNVTAIGWGNSNILKEVSIPITDSFDCVSHNDPENWICAGNYDGESISSAYSSLLLILVPLLFLLS